MEGAAELLEGNPDRKQGKVSMKHKKTAQVVTESVELGLVDPQGEAASIDSDLVFDPSDPYAVTMVFRTVVPEVRWIFGRELLIGGRFAPTGDGDVHVCPCVSSDGRVVVIIELCSPDGRVLVQADSRIVDTFVAEMLKSVPEGLESAYINFDDEFAQFLA